LAILRFRHPGCHFMKQGHWGRLCQQDTALSSRCRAAECMS
jgi:hypothetical protein